ncbi:hypothetical protein ACOSQ4_017736 [Xanthoceras sorbifolium]
MMAHQALLPPNSQQCIFLLQSKAKFLPLNSVLKFPATTASFTHYKSVGQGRGRLQATTHEHVSRPLADFPSTIWKDSDISFFASAASRISEFDRKYGRQVEELKNKVKEMLFAPTHDSAEKISLINSLFRLGVSYHFEAEIEEQLDHISESQPNFADNNDYDLYTIALLFRVFRERGYKISCGVFDKFIDDDGKFKETLTKDAKGMLSLYDAAHLRVHGEDILEEALAFTKAHLKTYSSAASEDRSSSTSHLAKQIMKALEMPLHKGIPRLEALQYMISFCGEEVGEKNDQTSSLLLFAKLDFNRVQLLHQQELYHLTRWWKDLNLVSELSYARDRIMEIYFWIVAVYFEPCFARARTIFTKTMKLSSLVDDTYDAYGTIEELRCFTDAIQRWDTSALDELPNYMKILYSALLNLFEEMNSEVTKEGRSYSVSQTKEMMVSAYHLEAEWFNQNYVPPFDEYLDNAIVSAELETKAPDNEKFDWFSAWCPVIPVCDLDKRVPHGKKVLGLDIVVWWDKNESSWKVFDDACPHKLAPLSEGRIDKLGRLQCAYNGWCFNSSGHCNLIPQAPPNGPPVNTSKKACVAIYPSTKKPHYLLELDDSSSTKLIESRDFPYGYEVLIENVAHVPYAHDGLLLMQQPEVKVDTEGGKPLEMGVMKLGINGFIGKADCGGSKFIAPFIYQNCVNPVVAQSNEQSVPSSTGKKELKDHWIEGKIMNAGPTNWQKACFVATKADAFVTGLRRWLQKYSGGQINWGAWKFSTASALPPTPPREQLMDRY